MRLFRLAAWMMMAALAVSGCRSNPANEWDDAPYESDKPADLQVKLGIEYMRLGRNDVALKKLQKALSMDNNNPEAHNAIAVLYEKLGETSRAESHYAVAAQLAPQDSSVNTNYGSFLCRTNRPAEAERHFVKALENPLYKTPEVAYTNAGMCAMRSGDYAKAETYLQKALDARPQFPVALYQLAELSYQQGNYPKAKQLLDKYLEGAQHNSQTLWLAVRTERMLGNKDGEASYALLLRSKFPDSDEAKQLRDGK